MKQSKYYNLVKKISLDNQSFVDSIPFELIDSQIVIEVQVNGSSKKHRCILDSGAGSFLFYHNDSINCEYPVIMKKTGADFNGSFYRYNLVSVDEIRIGKMKYKNIPVTNTRFPYLCEEKIDGLIGADIMHLANWQIDYVNRVIIVSDNINKLSFSSDTVSIPLLINSLVFHVSVPATLNGSYVDKMKVDLGAALDLYLNNSTCERIMEEGKLTKVIKGQGINGVTLSEKEKIQKYHQGIIDSLKLGSTFIAKHKIHFFTGSGLNTIGNEFLSNYKVTFGYESKCLILEPAKTIYKPAFSSSFGFSYRHSGNNLVVTGLYEKSPAFEKGIALGDIIMSINGIDYSNCTRIDYCQSNMFMADSVLLTVQKSSGELQEVVLFAKKLFDIIE